MRNAVRLLPVALALLTPSCSVFYPDPPAYDSIEPLRETFDASREHAAPMPDQLSWWEKTLHYVPNRFLDILDIVKVSLGVGPGMGIELYLSENAWAAAMNQRTWRLGLDGRAVGVFEEGHFKEWRFWDWKGDNISGGRIPIWATKTLRPYETPLQTGKAAVEKVENNSWDVGAQLHFLAGAEALVRPWEAWDLIVGLWGDDPAGDDYYVRSYPLYEYEPPSDCIETLIRGIDRVSEADLKSAVSTALGADTRIANGNEASLTVSSGDESATLSLEKEPSIIIGDCRLWPHAFRSSESGSLDYEARCTAAKLRYGWPAELEYTLAFRNRILNYPQIFKLQLRAEKRDGADRGQWVVTEIEDVTHEELRLHKSR